MIQVKVISVGFSRTGTASFVSPLKRVAYRPCHDNEAAEVADFMGKLWGGVPRGNNNQTAVGKMPIGEFLQQI